MKKILCLHGAYGSADIFQKQLAPFVDAFIKSGTVDFTWIDGGHSATPPEGFDTYFGAGPLYRFINFDGIAGLEDMLDKIRDVPEGMTAEDTMRKLIGDQDVFSGPAVKSTMDRLVDLLDEHPDIDGVLGYSEGATTAASLILEERRRFEEEGRPRRIKFGIFLAGWPPVRLADEKVQCLLADECEDVIDIPTCHIVGCNDPYLSGAMALFSMCDEDHALLFDHGKGHTVPRDARTVGELATAIQGTLLKVA